MKQKITRQEVFELLDDVNCISATLNYLYDRGCNDNKEIEYEFKFVAPYIGLDWAFPFYFTEEGYEHWGEVTNQLEMLNHKP